MTEQNCIFCKILRGEIPSNVIFEDEDFKVILDVGPATKGHSLIIPKAHYQDLLELPEELAAKVLPVAKKVATHMKHTLGCQGVNILQNNGAVAGQTVGHYHTHVIPRYEEGAQILTWDQADISSEEMETLKQELHLQ